MARDRRDPADQSERLGDVIDVRSSGDDFERGAASVADQVVFAARLPPVDRRRTGVGAPFSARMWEPSPLGERVTMKPPGPYLVARLQEQVTRIELAL